MAHLPYRHHGYSPQGQAKKLPWVTRCTAPVIPFETSSNPATNAEEPDLLLEKQQPAKALASLLKRIRIPQEAQRILGNSNIPVVSLERLNVQEVLLSSSLQPVVSLVRLPCQTEPQICCDTSRLHQQKRLREETSLTASALSDPDVVPILWTEPYHPDGSTSEDREQDSGFDCESIPDQPYILFDSGPDDWDPDERAEPEMFYLDPDPDQTMVIQLDPELQMDQDLDAEAELKCEVDIVQGDKSEDERFEEVDLCTEHGPDMEVNESQPEEVDGPEHEDIHKRGPEEVDGPEHEEIDEPGPEELDGPQHEEIDEPEPEELDGPEHEQIDEPGPEELDGLEDEEIDEPQPEELDGLEDEEIDESGPEELDGPEHEEIDEPGPEELDGPEHEEIDEPGPEELDGPEHEEIDEPGPEELDGPEHEEIDEPGPEELDGPEHEEIDEPRPEELDGPELEEIDEPRPGELDGPEHEEIDEPGPEEVERTETKELAIGTKPDRSKEAESDDFCAVCLNGGDLLCCDRCPKVYHLSCHLPPLIDFPQGDWVCTLCRADWEPLNTYDCETMHSRRGIKAPYTLSNQEQRRCEKLALQLYSHTLSAPFHEPVSPLARNYYQIIKRPIDLSVIRRKLDRANTLHYFSVEQFIDDVLLMFKNCATFNYPDSEVAQAGRNLEIFFLSRLKEVFTDRTFPTANQEMMNRARLRWLRKKKEGYRKKRYSFRGQKYNL